MPITTSLTDELATAWLTGRARIRNYHLTTQGNIHAALRTPESAEAGEDLWEYVVTNASDDVLQVVAGEILKNPTRQLIVAADLPEETQAAGVTARTYAEKTKLRPIGVDELVMVTDMSEQDVEEPIVPEQFTAEVVRNDDWYLVAFRTTEESEAGPDKLAARGRVAVVEGTYAVFDQIWTSPDFRRQGLGSLTMRYLSSLALESDVEQGLLIAGVEGQALYSYLGWTAIGDVVVLGHPDVDPKDQWATQTFEP